MEYNCEVCKYKTLVNQYYKKHIQTDKHKLNIELPKEICERSCKKCKKVLLSRTSLWRHNKVCAVVPDTTTNNIEINLLKQLLEKQEFLEKLVIEFAKNPSNNITNNNFTIMFLNEKCGSAINMLDFINSINVNTQTLQQIESQGYVEGVAKLVIDNLKLISVQTRPLHYTNTNNNHTVYTRQNNEWTEETEQSETVLENYMQELDEKLYTEMLVYQEKTDNSQIHLKYEILKANMLTHSKVTDKILSEVVITKELINNIHIAPI